MEPEQIVRELAVDGAWTQRQLDVRLARWGAREPSRYLTRAVMTARPTARAHRWTRVTIVRPSVDGKAVLRALQVRPQEIRPGELEHALGLAELRWRCGVSAERYRAQDTLGRDHRRAVARGSGGFGPAIADGVYETTGGVLLCEYDHGRYTARQVRGKLTAFRSATRYHEQRVLGSVWGVPTERRASWLRGLGVRDIVVLNPETWLG